MCNFAAILAKILYYLGTKSCVFLENKRKLGNKRLQL